MMRVLVGVISSACLLVACSTPDGALFSKLDAEDTGIGFVNENHETERSNIFTYEYFYNGGGVALGDINNDGLADVYFTSNIFGNKLYLNEGNFGFRDITEISGAACSTGWKTGATMADINADGLLDIYVCRSASPDATRRRNILLINNGDLTFTDRASEFGLDDDSFSTQAAFFDYDRDGDLDAFLLNHSLLMISNSFDITQRNTDERHPYVGNRLLRNDNNRFVDVSDSMGIYGPASNYGLGISLSDINNDGWIDIYAGCDYTGRDRLLINNHGESFTDATDSLLSHISKFTMGTDIADINGDGLMDLYTLDMLPEDNHRQKQLMGSDKFDAFTTMVKSGLHAQYMRNMLHLNNGNGTFSEIGQLAGVSNTDWSWGALFADFDNDGIQDLFVSNGFKRDLTDNDFAKYKAFQELAAARERGQPMQVIDVLNKFNPNKIPNYIYRGNGDLTFEDVTRAWGLDEPLITNGVAYADLDNDGDLDLVTNNMNDPAGVYRNNSDPAKQNFIKVQLKGGGKNLFAVGTRVDVYAGGRRFAREMLPVRGFQSSVDYTLHFGLGQIEKVDSLVARWPTGQMLTVVNPTINQTHHLLESGDTTGVAERMRAAPLFLPTLGPRFVHQENTFNDFTVQPLLPRMYSTPGPALAAADVNGDGVVDVFVGGANGQLGKLFTGGSDGAFKVKPQQWHPDHLHSEDVDAAFFDMDADGDQDLYVASGGYAYAADDQFLQDYLYENDGRGNFAIRDLPFFASSGSCVSPADADGDGDTDLFVGGRIIPGRYPEAPDSYLLINDGSGDFSIGKTFSGLGMVTDAEWTDLNQDNQPDLIVVGEWMPIVVLINRDGKFVDETPRYFQNKTHGFWNCVEVADFDADGDLDLVAGNQGLNTQMRASVSRPVTLYYGDFDDNGSVDPLLSYFIGERAYPYPSRDELTEQVPSFKKRFTTYKAYSDATVEDVLAPEERASSQMLTAYCLETAWFENRDGGFATRPLPVAFQMAPVFALVAADIDNDKRCDIISTGNLSATRARSGRMTGNYGAVALGEGDGLFRIISPRESGLSIRGDARNMLWVDRMLFVAINDGTPLTYMMNDE